MWRTPDLVVISDLHLAAERDRGLFRADSELAAFLTWLHREVENSFLVLNGDVFDFLVSDNGSQVLSLRDSPERAKKIIENHPEVFDALAKIANSPRHQLFILSGNHDPEIADHNVQSIFERRFQHNNFSPNVRWITSGQALLVNVGERSVLIEHGDLFDDWNRIEYQQIHNSMRYFSRMLDDNSYISPPGSNVVEHLTPFRQKYPWIDSLHPINEATFPLVWTFIKHDLNLNQARVFQKVLYEGISAGGNWLKRNLRNALSDKIVLGDNVIEDFSESNGFSAWSSKEINEPKSFSKRDRRALINRLKKASSEDSFFDIESPERNGFKQDFFDRHVISKQLSAVVHGHTHSAKSYTIGNGQSLYLNCGTWGRLLQLPTNDDSLETWKVFLAKLEAGLDESFFRPTYVRIKNDVKNGVVKATLNEWQKPVQAEWQIEKTSNIWESKE